MIDIFGSKNLLKIANNIYGQDKIGSKVISSTLESQFSSSIAPSSAQLELYTKEQQEIIISDFRKNLRKQESKGDILLVDFLSERNSIVNYKGGKITFNTEVQKLLKDERLVTMPMDARVKQLPNHVDKFSDIANEYDEVIICEFYLTNYYFDENNIVRLNPNQYGINKVNALLKTFYDYLKFHYSSYTYIQFETIYSYEYNSSKPSPWIYSDFSLLKLGENLSHIIEE